MQTRAFAFLILAVCALASAGCKKADPQESIPQFNGVTVDLPKLEPEFTAVGPEVRDSLGLVKRYFRYAQYPQALMELEKLSNIPGLAEPQKKLVLDLIEQTKQVIAKAPPQPGQ
jgi:hypothetical protein